jgi:hypothetical protein
MTDIEVLWQELRGSVVIDAVSIGTLSVNLFIGGLLALYLRFLYSRCGVSASDADSVTRAFPMLTIITTAVIFVVKSSLALSLGLVGALSIVRFRSAIKEPEELVYLFLCIAIGLSLGAQQPMVAIMLVVVSTVFSVGMHSFGSKRRKRRIMLTVSGEVSCFTSAEPSENIVDTVQELAGPCEIHRLDIESSHGQIRLTLPRTTHDEVGRLVVNLKNRLPKCDFSYVNLDSNL